MNVATTNQTESFAQLLEENLSKMDLVPGTVFDGVVLDINHEKRARPLNDVKQRRYFVFDQA